MSEESKHLDIINDRFDATEEAPFTGDWYEALGLQPEDIIEACRKKGVLTEKKQDMINAWGAKLLKPDYHLRSRTPKENIKGSEEEANYKLNVTKNAFKKTLNECTIAYGDDPRSLELNESRMCNNLVCRPGKVITNEDSYNDVYHSEEPTKKKQLTRCKSINSHICKESKQEEYPKKQYLYVPNSGVGDCLFIAYNHFLYLQEEIPSAVRERRKVRGKFDNITREELDKSEPIRKTSKKTRKSVVDWLKRNKHVIYNKNISPDTYLIQVSIHSLGFGKQYGADKAFKTFNRLPGNEMTLKTTTAYYNKITSDISDLDKYLTTNPKYYKTLVILMNLIYDEYVKKMSLITTFGTQIEVQVLSLIINRPIIVLNNPGGRSDKTKYVSYMSGLNTTTTNAIFIYHNADFDGGDDGNHYEILYPLIGTGHTTNTLSVEETRGDHYVNFLVEYTENERDKLLNETSAFGDVYLDELSRRITELLHDEDNMQMLSDDYDNVRELLMKIGPDMVSELNWGIINVIETYLDEDYTWTIESDHYEHISIITGILEGIVDDIEDEDVEEFIRDASKILPYQEDLIKTISVRYLKSLLKDLHIPFSKTGNTDQFLELIKNHAKTMPKSKYDKLSQKLSALGIIAEDTMKSTAKKYKTTCPECTYINTVGTEECDACRVSLLIKQKQPKSNVDSESKSNIATGAGAGVGAGSGNGDGSIKVVKEKNICPECTYNNESDAINCDICSNKLPKPKPKPKPETIKCNACTFINTLDSKNCEMCNESLNKDTREVASEDESESESESEDESESESGSDGDSDESESNIQNAIRILAGNMSIKYNGNSDITYLNKMIPKLRENPEKWEDIIEQLHEYSGLIVESMIEEDPYYTQFDKESFNNTIKILQRYLD
jgi:hypothetical protein